MWNGSDVLKYQQAVLNRIWCRILLEELYRFGVREVCVAPGSRSTPLTLEASAHPGLHLHTHFDERGLGYLALGLAKASQKPIAVVVTSGTAVANLLPAAVEAQLTREPLIFLTADRPIELIGCGANQAIEQAGIFSHHVTRAVNLPRPTTEISPGWLLTTVDQVMYEQRRVGGVIHINCPFPAPLYGDEPPCNDTPYLAEMQPWLASEHPYTGRFSREDQAYAPLFEHIPLFDKDIFKHKGVVILGALEPKAAQKAQLLAEQLGWPLLCDPQSGVSSPWAYYELWLQNPYLRQMLSRCEVILRFGSRLVSKQLNHWLQQQVTQTDCQYLYLSPRPDCDNQHHLPQQQFITDIPYWIETQMPHVWSASPDGACGWGDDMLPLLQRIPALVDHVIKASQQTLMNLPEIEIARRIDEIALHADLFIGNSLIVRQVDMLGTLPGCTVYSNRGASGIDGIVATAAGIGRMTQRSMVLMLGDTSLLYDINSLALLTETALPFVVVVINNDGGAIFDMLPVPPAQKTALYQMPHGYQFLYAARQFGLDYLHAHNYAEYRQAVTQHLAEGCGGLIVEVVTPPGQAAHHIERILSDVKALH
jgi:2-succinyl-5-enolpyruvyl-6-hydroxy-3-cyclohexene-1-carboxylate synthase